MLESSQVLCMVILTDLIILSIRLSVFPFLTTICVVVWCCVVLCCVVLCCGYFRTSSDGWSRGGSSLWQQQYRFFISTCNELSCRSCKWKTATCIRPSTHTHRRRNRTRYTSTTCFLFYVVVAFRFWPLAAVHSEKHLQQHTFILTLLASSYLPMCALCVFVCVVSVCLCVLCVCSLVWVGLPSPLSVSPNGKVNRPTPLPQLLSDSQVALPLWDLSLLLWLPLLQPRLSVLAPITRRCGKKCVGRWRIK